MKRQEVVELFKSSSVKTYSDASGKFCIIQTLALNDVEELYLETIEIIINQSLTQTDGISDIICSNPKSLKN